MIFWTVLAMAVNWIEDISRRSACDADATGKCFEI